MAHRALPPDGSGFALVLDGLYVIRIIDGGARGVGAAVAGCAGDAVVSPGVPEEHTFLFKLESGTFMAVATGGLIKPGTTAF